MKTHAKGLIAFLTALGTWGGTAAADGHYDHVELWGLTGVVVAGLTTWLVPNTVRVRSQLRRGDTLEDQ